MRRLVGETSARGPPAAAGCPLASVLVVLRVAYFTLNASHFVVATVCVAVLAIVACMR